MPHPGRSTWYCRHPRALSKEYGSGRWVSICDDIRDFGGICREGEMYTQRKIGSGPWHDVIRVTGSPVSTLQRLVDLGDLGDLGVENCPTKCHLRERNDRTVGPQTIVPPPLASELIHYLTIIPLTTLSARPPCLERQQPVNNKSKTIPSRRSWFVGKVDGIKGNLPGSRISPIPTRPIAERLRGVPVLVSSCWTLTLIADMSNILFSDDPVRQLAPVGLTWEQVVRYQQSSNPTHVKDRG